MGCSQNVIKIKNNQGGQLLDLLNLCKGFQPPVGQIKDLEQLKNCLIFIKFHNQLSGLRNVREDQNQFYNIIFFTYFSQICQTKSNQKFQKIISLCDELEWKLFYKSKTYLNSKSELKDQFKKTLQISFEKCLFEFFYNEISSNDSFYALSIIFMRNWVFQLKQKQEKNVGYDKILDWDIDFNLEDQNLLDEVSRAIDMTISVLDANHTNLKNQNNNQIIIVKQQQNLFIGLEQNYFKRLVPSQLIYTLYKNTCLSRQVAVEFQNFVGQNFAKQFLINEYGLSNEMFQEIQLQGFKRVRGDGNCFYNTIIFQYLKYIICEFNDTEFAQFLKNLDKIKFYIKHQTIQDYSDDLQKFHKTMFKSIVYEMRGWQNRAEKFEAEFANTNNIFYALAIIYIKNLCHHLVSENQEYTTFLGDEALNQIREWEFETDNIQVLLIVISEYLKIQLHLYVINSDQLQVEKQYYEDYKQNNGKKYDIFLIYNPGHYCIGLKEL